MHILSAKRLRSGLLLLWVSSLLVCLLVSCSVTQPPPPGDPMQVDWGATVYRLECARCHEPGHVAPVLTEERLVRYHDAQQLFAYIRKAMPLDKPGALPEQDYWDVTAYVLKNANLLLISPQTALTPATSGQVNFTPQ